MGESLHTLHQADRGLKGLGFRVQELSQAKVRKPPYTLQFEPSTPN